ncbi:MAG: Bug family tripartite tricarboxylate transporter substrate binding protein [Limnohabitans sp.]
MKRQTLTLLAGAALGALLAANPLSALAQSYPSRPVKVIIPFPPGGTLDAVGRQLALKLSEQTGQQFVIENRPGGNGIIGADAVAKAPADGYTLLFNASTFTTAPMTMKQVPYGVVKDFAPVALVAKAPLSVAINKNLPVTDIKSLIAYAKANPGKMTFAVGSVGSAGHLATELLKKNGGLDYTVVPYKGTAPAFQDLIGGQIDGFIDPILGSLQYHKSGLLRVVAVTSSQRTPNLPDVPTVAETILGYEFYSWYGLWAPVKTPQDIKDQLNAQVNKALTTDMKDKLIGQGLIVGGGSIEVFRKFQADDMAKSQKLITDGNIRLE